MKNKVICICICIYICSCIEYLSLGVAARISFKKFYKQMYDNRTALNLSIEYEIICGDMRANCNNSHYIFHQQPGSVCKSNHYLVSL